MKKKLKLRSNVPTLDAQQNAFMERQLDYLIPTIYQVKRPELRARSFVPPQPGVPAGAETVTYFMLDKVGTAKIISAYGKDLPRADVKGEETSSPIRSLGTSWGYNISEIDAASMANRNLEAEKGMAAMRAMEQLIEDLHATGDAKSGLKGLLNIANAITYTIANGAGGDTEWETKTPMERLADMTGIVQEIRTQTKNVEAPNLIVVPDEQYSLIAETPLQTGSDTTPLSFFRANNPWVKEVDAWYKLKQAGAASADRMLCYRRDPEVLGYVEPKAPTPLPPQAEGLEVVVPLHARSGGVICRYPMAVAYGDGI